MKKLNTALASFVVITALGTPAFARPEAATIAAGPDAAGADSAGPDGGRQQHRLSRSSPKQRPKTMATGHLVRSTPMT